MGSVHLGTSLLVVPAGGEPVLGIFTAMERDEAARCGFSLLPIEELRRAGRTEGGEHEDRAAQWEWALRQAGVEPGPIGLAGRYGAGAVAVAARRLSAAGWEVEAFDRDLLRLRRRKTDWERQQVRWAAEGTVAAFRAAADELAAARWEPGSHLLRIEGEPLTAGRLRRRIGAELARHGLEQPEGNIVSAGRDAAVPHSLGDSARLLEAGETIVVDLYPKGHLFADCTRTFCVGEPPAAVAEAHGRVREALERSRREAVPGVSAAALQERTCELFEAAGWASARGSAVAERGYVHGLGHGVGYELHELPAFRGEEDEELAPGDVFTLEPGLYDPEAGFGVRLEDLLLMGEEGSECLTPLPYELDPRAW